MSRAVDDLLAILDLEQLEVNLFRGRSPQVGWQRVFGGQVIGQALVAACRTVDGRPPAAFAARLLPAAGRSQGADHLRGRPHPRRAQLHAPAASSRSSTAGRSSPCRRRSTSPSRASSTSRRCRRCRRPRTLPSEQEMKAGVLPLMPEPVRAYYERERPIELRPVEFQRYLSREPMHAGVQRLDPRHRAAAGRSGDPSMRARLRLRHDAARHLPDRARPHRVRAPIQPASLDHALWFHRPFRADEWLLYAQDSPNASGARGFSRGLIFAQNGALVASVAQEGLIRERDDQR